MAVEQIKMPQLGESVTEGTITKWFVSSGDRVKKYDPLAEVMTDKVTAEIPSSFTGVIKTLIAEEGETLSVGEIICSMEVDGSVSDSQKLEEQRNSVKAKSLTAADTPKKVRYSPAVVQISQQHGIDLSLIEGTGAGGRITRKDLLKLIDSGGLALSEKSAHQDALKEPSEQEQISRRTTFEQLKQSEPFIATSEESHIPVTGVRKTIAANMTRSKQEIPHAWTMIEVDATNVVAYRNSIKDEFKNKEGFNLTYFAFFVKAAAQALKEFPQINSTWAGEKIIQKRNINISIAVAKEDALYVPVIKNADEKSIKGIAREITDLAAKVRSGKLAAEDMSGGTFTVNNTGSFGSIQSMGIINYPQAAILQIESIVKRPVVMNNNMIAIRDMVNLCMSLDHRILDGFICGSFLGRIKDILENASAATTPIY